MHGFQCLGLPFHLPGPWSPYPFQGGCPFSPTDSYTQRAWSQTATVHAALSSGPEGQIIRLLKKKSTIGRRLLTMSLNPVNTKGNQS